MSSFQHSHVSDDLLSAYLDGSVTTGEREQIEQAIAADPETAWRLESLRYTVDLLRQLPTLEAPRSFALSESLVEEQALPNTGRAGRGPQPSVRRRGAFQRWRQWWQMGNPLLRNAAAASFALFLVLVAGQNAIMVSTTALSVPAAQAPVVTPLKAENPDARSRDRSHAGSHCLCFGRRPAGRRQRDHRRPE